MAVKGEWIKFGEFSGYLAQPVRLKEPQAAVMVVQEIWGIEPHIQDLVHRFAAAGYVALAPTLFADSAGNYPPALEPGRIDATKSMLAKMPPGAWRNPAVLQAQLATLPAQQAKEINETLQAVFSTPQNMSNYMPILRATHKYMKRELPASRGQKIACVGYCMGGALSAIMACEEDPIDAAGLFYGTTPPPELLATVHCPVIAFYGELDQRVNAGIGALEAGMQAAGQPFEHFVYPGANHGFFNDTGPAWQIAAARDSWARLLDFLRRTLT